MQGAEVEFPAKDEFMSPKDDRKKSTTGYAILFVVLSVFLGFLSFVSSVGYFGAILSKSQVLAFIGLGVLHCYLSNRYFRNSSNFSYKNVSFSFSLAALILCALFLLDFVNGTNNFFISFASSCAFVTPSVIYVSGLLLKILLKKESKVWYNFENIKDQRATVYLNSIPLAIKLTRKYFDVEEEIFYATMPGHSTFGQLFNQFLLNLDENQEVETIDETGRLYGWMFYKESVRGFKKFIDPELTLRANHVKEGVVIIAKRVKRAAEIENQELQETA